MKMETTIVSWFRVKGLRLRVRVPLKGYGGYLGIMLGVSWGNIGGMEKKMETTI